MKPPKLSAPITVRIPIPTRAALEAEAERRGMILTDLIRERLDLTAAIQGPLETLREEVLYALRSSRRTGGAAGATPGQDGAGDDPLLVEVLLLLRSMAGPSHLRDAQNAVNRLGHTLWTGEERG